MKNRICEALLGEASSPLIVVRKVAGGLASKLEALLKSGNVEFQTERDRDDAPKGLPTTGYIYFISPSSKPEANDLLRKIWALGFPKNQAFLG